MEITVTVIAPDIVKSAQLLSDALAALNLHAQNSTCDPAPTKRPEGSAVVVQPQYDLAQLAVAATPLIDAGKAEEIRRVLHSMGAQALMQLSRERWGEFAVAIRAMGARI